MKGPSASSNPPRRGRPPAQTKGWESQIAAALDELTLHVRKVLRGEYRPSFCEEAEERFDDLLDDILAARLQYVRGQFQVALDVRERATWAAQVDHLLRLRDRRGTRSRQAELATSSGRLAEGWLLWRLQDPGMRSRAVRALLGRPRDAARPREREPEAIAHALVGLVWGVSSETIRRAVEAHRAAFRRTFVQLAVADAVAGLVARGPRSVPLTLLLQRLRRRELARRKALRRRQRRKRVFGRWATTWELPATVAELRQIVVALRLPVSGEGVAACIPRRTFNGRVRARLAKVRKHRLAEYNRGEF
jgi:hypothetical protein